MNKDGKDISFIYDRDNIALFCVLKCITNHDTCFIISNAHLLYNVKRGDIKLGQTYQLAESLAKLKAFYSRYLITNEVILIKSMLSFVVI
jgi:hypothetical protein